MLNLSRRLRPAQTIAMLSLALPLSLPLPALAQSSGTDIAAALSEIALTHRRNDLFSHLANNLGAFIGRLKAQRQTA